MKNPAKLPEEKKSRMWPWAVILYSVSLPFVWISLILFYSTGMMYDVACSLAHNADSISENHGQWDYQACFADAKGTFA